MVCTGHFTQPHLPLNDFPGNFKFAIPIIVPIVIVYLIICYYHWRYIDSNPIHIMHTYIHHVHSAFRKYSYSLTYSTFCSVTGSNQN
ncbi:unnamed protein product [Oncorhynchus mykiss]|uniref:Uncharacterized protein n=1 Tax=Oncorhynchus mykiss TaxID=8022 RepID=A0A060XGR1_ONCMY|nr:unnamed protein product [Oncorhynchus mykiss]